MKGMFHFLLIILISLVLCSETPKKYEDYAHQFFNHERQVSLYDELGKQYIFESWIKPSDKWTIYRYYETETAEKLASIIQFTVITTNATKNLNKTLHIKFTKLRIAPKNSILKNTEYFLKIFEKMYEYSPYGIKLKIEDEYNPLTTPLSNLKFSYFLKYGKTFFEHFNFQYIVKIPNTIRETKNIKLEYKELKKIKEKYTKIAIPETISELVIQIESNYDEKEAELIFADVFGTNFLNAFNNFPTDMVYRPANAQPKYRVLNTNAIVENQKNKHWLMKIFSSKSKESKEDPDNFL